MKKAIYFCLCCLLVNMLCSCAQNTTITYANLPESEQAAIDFVLSKGDMWDDGNCYNAGFTTHDEQSTFFVKTRVGGYTDSDVMKYEYYHYDAAIGTFEMIDSRIIGETVWRDGSPSGTSKKWESTWSYEKKKNYLAKGFQ